MTEEMSTSDPRSPYVTMESGRRYHFLAPKASEILVEDVISGLMQPRWNAHNPTSPSILVHSWMVWRTCIAMGESDPMTLRTALAHDAHEAFMGDVARPAKVAMRMICGGESPWDQIENLGMLAIAVRFDLMYPHPPIVKAADNAVLAWEMHRWGQDDFEAYFGGVDFSMVPRPCTTSVAIRAFVDVLGSIPAPPSKEGE